MSRGKERAHSVRYAVYGTPHPQDVLVRPCRAGQTSVAHKHAAGARPAV